jgi:hypothetical protein
MAKISEHEKKNIETDHIIFLEIIIWIQIILNHSILSIR